MNLQFCLIMLKSALFIPNRQQKRQPDYGEQLPIGYLKPVAEYAGQCFFHIDTINKRLRYVNRCAKSFAISSFIPVKDFITAAGKSLKHYSMIKITETTVVYGIICCFLLASCATSKKSSTPLQVVAPVIKTDAPVKTKKASFFETVAKQGTTDKGFCAIHKMDNKYYFEIPDSIFDKDILIVNRISKAAAQLRPDHDYAGYGADQIGENVIQFCKGTNNKVFIKKIEYSSSRSTDSSENGMYRAVLNSNLPPIMAAFDIKGWAPDSSSLLIDMTDYINNDNELLFFSGQQRRVYNLGYLQNDKSYIQKVAAFPLNIEIKTVKTFSNANPGLAQSLPYLTYELNTSIVLLPKNPMKTRYVDERVGYFGRGYVDFDIAHPQGFNGSWLVTRWRLEPKDEDIEQYKKGILVEPKKPIVFYIDPATPKKWVPFLIRGVNAWQKAFEKAGFKNAIYALEAPLNDPEWSLEDTRHSAIVYKASWVQNASGPNVNDPRTGEILEAHINWYHNITEILHDWYFIQAAASDSNARKMIFDDSVMGKLITYVCTHEVGHTLGLAHNFASSSTVPVDSLRNKKWVEANGMCPSIMDYSRFNYVAQPEDSVGEKGLIGQIGAYDEWAIEWGYRWFPQLKTAAEEKDYLNKWVIKKLEDPRLLFAYSGARCQTEDLGDDAIKAGTYGIRNLKRIMPELINWSKLPDENYDGINKMERQLIYQFQTYLSHVSENIGGRYETPKTVNQKGNVLEYVSPQQQKAAVDFLQQEIFKTPEWLFNKETYAVTGGIGHIGILNIQKEVLNDIMAPQKLNRLIYSQALQPAKAYSPNQFFTDLENGIWCELQRAEPISLYRRNLQKAYVARLLSLQNATGYNTTAAYTTDLSLIDLLSVLKAHKLQLQKKIMAAMSKYKDEETRWHLADMIDRLKSSSESDTQPFNKKGNSSAIDDSKQYNLLDEVPGYNSFMQAKQGNCWGNSRDNK